LAPEVPVEVPPSPVEDERPLTAILQQLRV
jgi:hypothetical protein